MLGKKEIQILMEEAAVNSPYNNFQAMGLPNEPMWEKPLVGFAAGDDKYFTYFKETIGEFYWLPKEVYNLKFKEEVVEDGELTVVSLAFPQVEVTKIDQRMEKQMPCERWLRSRGEWEFIIGKITEYIVEELRKQGISAVSIDEITEFSRHTSETFGIASNWSHRHTAFVAGLGTFGLSDGLITEKGKAMRFTSIILKGKLEPTERPYTHHYEYCTHHSQNKCGACITRCPVNAISKAGHDKELCSAYLQKIKNEIGPDYVRNTHYISGCGLCQSKVPCESGIPK